MKAYLINMHLLVPRSRSFAKVKAKYKGYISQKMAVSGAFVFHKVILFFLVFFRNTLGNANIIQFVNVNMLFWACDINRPEGYRGKFLDLVV